VAEDMTGEPGDDVSTRIDARPIREASTDTNWDHAIALRDQLTWHVRKTLEHEHIQALVFESAKGNYPPWVKLEAWLPDSDGGRGRERVELLVVVDVRPYHRHTLVTNVQVTRGARSIRIEERTEFPSAEIASWTRYAVGLGGKPASYHPLLDALMALIPGRRRNPIERAYRTGFWSSITGPLGVGSLLLVVIPLVVFDEAQGSALSLFLLGGIGVVATAALVARRKHAVFVPSQSVISPRDLGLVDSWHAAIAELGREYEEVKARLVACVTAEHVPGLSFGMETYGYRTPNGFEQRERLVVTKGQSIVQVHIYRFSDDLFVGWHAYLNWSQWAETVAVSSKTSLAQQVEFRELRQGYYVPNQFDLIDLNSLSELVHRRLERELKFIMKEKEIDQEVDFKVIRGDRDTALDKARHADPGTGRRGWRYISTQPT